MPANRLLQRTAHVALGESRCGDVPRGPGPEEQEPSFMIVFPQTGTYVRHFASDEIVASPAAALFVDRGEVHATSHPAGGHDTSLYLSVSTDVAEPLLDDDGFRTRSAPTDPATDLALKLAARRTRSGLLTPTELDDLAHETVAALVPEGRPVTRPAHRRMVAAAQEYISVHFAEDCGLPAIAAHVGVSRHHLSRTFHRVAGTTVTRYRAAVRFRHAVTRLLDGAEDISVVAVECGFYDHAHLANAARLATGMAPGAVRALGAAARQP